MNKAIKARLKEKTALKLVTKYADEYHSLEKTNQQLIKENNDLKVTLQLNKDIIEGYILKTMKNKSSFVIKKQNEEIVYLSRRLNEVVEELNKAKQLIDFTQNTANKFESELESANRKLFVLDNLLQEKENIIKAFYFNHSVKNESSNSKVIDEKKTPSKPVKPLKKSDNKPRIKTDVIYVASPNCILNKINEELSLVKEDKGRLKKDLSILKEKLKIKEDVIKLLELKVKEKKVIRNKEREKTNENKNQIVMKGNTDDYHDNLLLKQLKDNTEVNALQIQSINSEDEWRQVLYLNDITQDEYNRLSRLQLMKKPFAIIETIYKCLLEKNNYLKLILQENQKLASSNLKLNKVNMEQSYKLQSSIPNINRNQLQENSSITYLSTYSNGCSLKMPDNHDNTTMMLNHSNTFESEEEKNRTIIQNMNNISISSSLNSNDFKIGMALDQFDLLSELSNKKYRCNTKE